MKKKGNFFTRHGLMLLLMAALAVVFITGSKFYDEHIVRDPDKLSADQLVGTSSGFGGEVKVALTMDGDAITDVMIVGENETPEIGGAAIPQLAEQVKEAQSSQIDGVAGASLTSGAVKAAVAMALGEEIQTEAQETEAVAEPAADETEAAPAEAVAAETAPAAGESVSASALGFGGDVTVTLTKGEDGKITDVAIDGPDETPTIGGAAIPQLVEQVLAAQSAEIDGVAGASLTTGAVKEAVAAALAADGAAAQEAVAEETAEAETEITITPANENGVITAAEWSAVYPEITASMEANGNNNYRISYLEEDPYLTNIYEGYGFAKDYTSAVGHNYCLEDVHNTERPHALANCLTCKTPDYTKMVNDMGEDAYMLDFEETFAQMNESTSCYNCHENQAGEDGKLVVTHSYVTKALGENTEKIDAATLSCGQCHIEYYFAPENKATSMPYSSVEEMTPEAILAYYDEMGFSDWTQESTGTGLLKAQHPEMETFLQGIHASMLNCASCHMATEQNEEGKSYRSHEWVSPLASEQILSTCTACHGDTDMAEKVHAIQDEITASEKEVGEKLSGLKDALAAAVAEGRMSEDELNAVRKLYREAQWFWDYCYVENSEGAHNSALSRRCLSTSSDKIAEAMELLTTEAAESAVETEATDTAAESAVETEAAAPAEAASGEGTTVSASELGFGGDVTVNLTVAEDGTITDVAIDGPDETPEIGGKAIPQLAEQVLAAQGAEIDGVAGASLTSGAVKEATAAALAKCEAPAEKAQEESEKAAGTTFTPGTYTGTSVGFGGEVTATIEVTEDAFASVVLTGDKETTNIGTFAVDMLDDAIMQAQSPKVDTLAGATVTSRALLRAVNDAIKQAGADPDAFPSAQKEEIPTEQKETADLNTQIVIVGAGGAGMTAAIKATQAGADVIIVEKMPYVGGNTTKATGGMNAAETHYQAEQGIEDSVEQFIEDTMKGGHDINDIELVTKMASESAACIDWLDSINAPLPKVSFSGGATNARIHAPEDGSGVGAYLVTAFLNQLNELGINVMYNTKATKILMDGDKAVGIVAEDNDTVYTINADAVILATGGFGANNDMIVSYREDLDGTVTTNTPGATGDGIVMAEEIGAALVDIEQIQLHPTVEQSTSMLITEGVRGDGAILVNQSGKRFTNELLTRDAVSAAELAQEGSYAYIIFDQNLRDNLKAIEKYVETNITVQADSIEELAELIGIDPATLAQTLADWNQCVADQKDEEFGRETGMEHDLSVAPFYAIKIAPGIHHTMGGLKINTEAMVINTEGNVIPGLYAAGEVTGGVHGGNRIGGNAVADIVVFGNTAGTNAAAYVMGTPEGFENAAKETEETEAVEAEEAETEAVTAEAESTEAAAETPAAEETTVSAFALGFGGDVTVTLTKGADGTITDVVIDAPDETPNIGGAAVEQLAEQVLAAQSAEIDGVAGASLTSGAVKEAVAEALSK